MASARKQRRQGGGLVHCQVAIQVLSTRGGGPTVVVVRELDLTDPDKREKLTWLRLADVVEGGHAISEIGKLIKGPVMHALRLAGVRFIDA